MGNDELSSKQVGSHASRRVTRRLVWIQPVCISINAVPALKGLRQFDGAFRRFMLILVYYLFLEELADFSTWFILLLPLSLCIITCSRGVRQRICNLEVPGSNPVIDFFNKISFFFMERLE